MIEIPVIDDVLVVPDDLAGVGVERERRVVIQVLLVVAAEDELRRGDRHRRADVDQVRSPGRSSAPSTCRRASAAPSARRPTSRSPARRARDRARAPELFAGLRVVRGDDAGVVAGIGLALPAGDHLAVGDDRPRARVGARACASSTCVSHTSLPVLRVDGVDADCRRWHR